jgi:hypothetical protein
MIHPSTRLSAALRAAFLSSCLVFALTSSGLAQSYRDSAGTTVPGLVLVDPSGAGPLGVSSNPLKISGSFSATLSGFTPTPAYASLPVSTVGTSYSVALPSGAVVIVYNTGSSDAYVKLGSSSVTASASNDVVKAGGWMAFTVGTNTYIAAYSTGGATSFNISGGSGLPTGTGASSGGGGGGTVTQGSQGMLTQPWYWTAVQGGALVSNTNGLYIQPGSGATFAVTGTFWQALQPVNQTQVAGVALGAPTAWGTAPSGNVQGVNANIIASTPIQTTPKTGTFAFSGCTVGISSAQCLAAGTYNHVQFVNNSTANIACAWGGTAVLSSATSIQLAPGQPALWGPATAGVPTVALNCIAAAASSPLYLETN